MVDSHVVSALKAKRGEIAGRIHFAQHELNKLIRELDSIDTALRIFDPAIDLDAIKVRRVPVSNPVPKNGTARLVLSELRNATEPLSTRVLAIRVMELHGLNTDSQALLRTMRRRVHSALEGSRQRGLVFAEMRGAAGMLWSVAR